MPLLILRLMYKGVFMQAFLYRCEVVREGKRRFFQMEKYLDIKVVRCAGCRCGKQPKLRMWLTVLRVPASNHGISLSSKCNHMLCPPLRDKFQASAYPTTSDDSETKPENKATRFILSRSIGLLGCWICQTYLADSSTKK